MALDIVQSVAFMAFAAGGAADINFPIPNQPAMTPTSCLKAFLEGGEAPDTSTYPGFFPTNNPSTSACQLIGGDWSVVWGPIAMLQNDVTTGPAVNSMYVAYSPSQNTYVVAVAGTNFVSIYDWVAEDFDILEADLVPWPIGTDGDSGPMISRATDNGLSNLLGMSDPVGGTLKTYLDQVADKAGNTLVFTGHSLGGALSPTLALYLYPDPTTAGWSAVHVLPLAGPTPGNIPFVDLFNAKYRPVDTNLSPYTSWNSNYQNYYDLIPLAWNALFEAIPDIFGVENDDGVWVYYSYWGYVTGDVWDDIAELSTLAETATIGVIYGDVSPFPFTANWGYFAPGPTVPPVSGSSGWSPVWTPWPAMGPNNPISYLDGATSTDYSSDSLGNLLSTAHLDQYYDYFQLIPPEPLPQSTAQLAAARQARLKKHLAASIAGLRSTGVPVRRQPRPKRQEAPATKPA